MILTYIKNKAKKGQSIINYSYNYQTYLEFFPTLSTNDNKITGEATPFYMTSIYAAKLLAKYAPWGKQIVLLREPIIRSYSRMSHLWEISCIRKKFQHGICDPRYLSIIYDHVISIILPAIQTCVKEHWYIDDKDIINSDYIENFYSLNICIGKKRKKAVLQWSSTAKTSIIPNKIIKLSKTKATSSELLQFNKNIRNFKAKKSLIAKDYKEIIYGICSRSLLWHSLYSPQLYNLKHYAHKDHLLVLKSEDLYHNGVQVMNMIIDYLQLQPYDYSQIVQHKYNVGYDTGNEKNAGLKMEQAIVSKHLISNSTRTILQQFLSHIINKLDNLCLIPNGIK